MKKIVLVVIAGLLAAGTVSKVSATVQEAVTVIAVPAAVKPNAGQALQILKAGNVRFFSGKSTNTHSGIARDNLAGKSNQVDAYATILSCFDSLVPVERIFDSGSKDLFVVRVAGNVVDIDEVVSIEYGLGHVNTPLLVVFGHSQRNAAKSVRGNTLIPFGSEENVWQGIEDLFMRSPATRAQVKSGKVKVVGAIYDVALGTVNWLPEARVTELLARVEKSPKKAIDAPVKEGNAIAKNH